MVARGIWRADIVQLDNFSVREKKERKGTKERKIFLSSFEGV
jgi:hypothetical protein